MKGYWHLRAKERAAAKEQFEREHPERTGPTLDTVQDGQPGFLGPTGRFWPYKAREEKRVCVLGAASGLAPSQRVTVIFQDGKPALRGKSGTVYNLFMDSMVCFRCSYKAAVHCEKALENQTQEVTT